MLRIKFFIFSLACVGLFLTSCGDDPIDGGTPGGGGVDAPFVSLLDGLDVLSFDATVTPGTDFRVTLDATSNGAQLKAVEVLRDGFSLSTEEFDNEAIVDLEEQNPQLLFGTDKDGLTWTYGFETPTTEGSYLYDFEVTDDNNEVATASITITVEAPLEVVDPSITVASNTTITAPANSLIKVNVTGETGTYDFASISVFENGSIISDLTRVRYNDIDFDSNPMPLFSPDTEGFTSSVTVRTTTGTNSYTIRLTDTEGNEADFTFEVIEEVNTTPLQNTFNFVLFSNAAGPNLGGLDLDAGVAVSSSSAMAEIRDRGIDIGLPNSTNWLQEVEPVNGSELRIVDLNSLPEGFNFADVTSKEQVTAAFNGGTNVASSPMLQEGDLLAVSSPTNIYIIQVETVTVTTTDNTDSYEFSIKY